MLRTACLLGCLALAACRTDPVTGKVYYSPLGNDFAAQERFLNENFVTQIQIANDGGLLPEPEIEAACRRVFADVARAVPETHRRGFRYSLFLTASPQLNAYTYGGGRVHCHLGLLARCEDAAEFAGLVAHEIGHNSHDHFGQGIGRSTVAGTFSWLGGLAGRPGRQLAETLGGVVLVQFTRAREREADDRAVDYAAAAGYDPAGSARFFEAMERDFGASGPEFFQTHPRPENRVKAIRRRAAKLGPGPFVRDDPAFRKAVARAREILPYYVALYEAMAREDLDALYRAADAGARALPHHAQFHFWRGVVLEGDGRHAEALAAFRRAAALDSTNVLLPLVHSSVEFTHENWPEAERAADRVLAIIPAIPGAYLVRGVARVKLGRLAEGYSDLDVVMKAVKSHERERVLEEIHKQVPDYAFPR